MKYTGLIFAVLIAVFFYPSVHAGECKEEGSIWKYNFKRVSPVQKSTDLSNGVYTIKCTGSKFVSDDGVDIVQFANTVPSVIGMEGNIPWFAPLLNGGDQQTYDFKYESGKSYTVSGTVKEEGNEIKKIALGKFETKKMTAIDNGHRAGKRIHTYYVSPMVKGVVAVEIEYNSGTTIKMELLEYKTKPVN